MKTNEQAKDQKKQTEDTKTAQAGGEKLTESELDAISGGFRPHYRPHSIPRSSK